MTVPVPLGDAAYDIILGGDLLIDLPELLSTHCPASHYVIITDSIVQPLHGDRVHSALSQHFATTLISFPAGEWNKTRETWSTLTDQLLAAGLDRHAAIIAVGGGVVGDVAGFVAATYLRGIRYVQVPTTLLAMIDSSIGGKCGVDTPAGKNLVGAFHQPRVVVADMTTLSTLPPVQLAAGMSEAIKHGVITDAAYFRDLLDRRRQIRERDPDTLLEVVHRSIRIKAEIVAQDERERGRRAVLNYGHTIGHALEATMGYELLHGEAVAIGLVAEARLGERMGVTHGATVLAVQEAVEAFELPTEPAGEPDPANMLAAMQHDKKKRDGTVRFALPVTLGEMAREDDEWTVEAPESVIAEILKGLT